MTPMENGSDRPTHAQLHIAALTLSAATWRETYYLARRASLYGAVPGLLLALAALLRDYLPDWAINGLAGCTLATSASVLFSALVSSLQQRRERKVDVALAERFWNAQEEQ